MTQFVRKLVPDNRTVDTVSRELKALFGRSAQAFYPRDLLRPGDRRDPFLSFEMKDCRIHSWEFLSTWCRWIGSSTVRSECASISWDAPPPDKRDWLANLAGNPATESSWYFTVSPPNQTDFRSQMSVHLHANEHECEDSRLSLSTHDDPAPELLPHCRRFWETAIGTIGILNNVELMVGDTGRWGPKPTDNGAIRTEQRPGVQPSIVSVRFDSKQITETLLEVFKTVEQLSPDLVSWNGSPSISFRLHPDSLAVTTKLLHEKNEYYDFWFLGGYHKDFSPEELGLGDGFPAEGYWRFPLMTFDHRTASSHFDYVWTPTERFVEVCSGLDSKKLIAFLRKKQFADDCELWEGTPGERWGLHALSQTI